MGPLKGLKVVEMTGLGPGPFCTMMLGDMGAEVVRSDRPQSASIEGDPAANINARSRRSVALDLKTSAGREAAARLISQADILIEGFRPGVMERLGVGWESLREINPSLIYGSGTGYGLSGPARDMLAMDHTIQAASGVMSVTGDADSPPSRAGGAPADIMGGIHMYAGVMAALVGRQQTGKGTLVEVSMLESMYFMLCSELTSYHKNGEFPKRNSARSPAGSCPYGRYECKDGYIAIISVAERHWQSICKVVGREDLIDNPDYATVRQRLEIEDQVNEVIESFTRTRTRDEAYLTFRDGRIPVAPVRNLEEVSQNPHLHERGMLHHMEHEEFGDLIIPSSPIRYSDYGAPDLALFPEAGAHNDEVYSNWLDLSEKDLADLKSAEVI